jgi:hypothetical protein
MSQDDLIEQAFHFSTTLGNFIANIRKKIVAIFFKLKNV